MNKYHKTCLHLCIFHSKLLRHIDTCIIYKWKFIYYPPQPWTYYHIHTRKHLCSMQWWVGHDCVKGQIQSTREGKCLPGMEGNTEKFKEGIWNENGDRREGRQHKEPFSHPPSFLPLSFVSLSLLLLSSRSLSLSDKRGRLNSKGATRNLQ